MNEAPVSGIVDVHGRPARQALADTCPKCGTGEDQRRASGGFGVPWTVCSCGYEWRDRPWKG